MLRFVLSFIFICLFVAPDAHSYLRTRAIGGFPLFWAGTGIQFLINPSNSSSLPHSSVQSEMINGFERWNVSGANLNFSYSQSTSNPNQSGFDGQYAVFFTSNSSQSLVPNVIAVTEVLYFTDNGQIAEVDMLFNDDDFLFTANVGDTGQSGGGKTKMYLGDIATHEFGHALGFDHNASNESSLIFTAFSGQFSVSEDDKSGVRTIFPASGTVAQKGSISGTVKGQNGGIFATQVSAINMSTGQVEASALANSDGSFRIGDLQVGKYTILTEPYLIDSSTISAYWTNKDHRFCSSNQNFARNFYSSCGADGKASVISVSAGSVSNIGVAAPSCDLMSQAGSSPSNIASAKIIDSSGAAVFHRLSAGGEHYYRVNNVSGTIEARALAWRIYSPLDLKVEILNLDGSAISGSSSIEDITNPLPGGFVDFDSEASVSSLPLGDYLVKISAASSNLSYLQFPGGYYLTDFFGYYMASIHINGDIAVTGKTDMAACATVNNTLQSEAIFTLAEDSSSGFDSEDEPDFGSGCGLIDSNSNGGGPSQNMDLSMAVLLFLAMFAKLFASHYPRLLARYRAKR